MDFTHLKRLFFPNVPQWVSGTVFSGIELGDGYRYIYDSVSNGYGGYRSVNLYLLNDNDPTFARCIVNEHGYIKNSPGIIEGDWKNELEMPFDGKVRFSFRIYRFKEGKAQVEWTLQPDGRYFEDEDGFGAEHCSEISLCSYMDKEGNFLCPFFKKE